MVMPGDNATVAVSLDKPVALDIGSHFAIREGGKTVAPASSPKSSSKPRGVGCLTPLFFTQSRLFHGFALSPEPMMRKLPEPIFEFEFDAATSLGFKCPAFR